VGGLNDFRYRRKRFLEARLFVGGASLKTDLDEKDKAHVNAKWVKTRVIALNDAKILKAAHAREAGARRQGDAVGERLVGESRFILKMPENLAVDAVE
jgi:hypothetical protein